METYIKEPVIIKQVGEKTSGGFLFFGKRFDGTTLEKGPAVLVHPDYPHVTEDAVHRFCKNVRYRSIAVVSGTVSPVHPYRLIKLDRDRHERYMVTIPQEIRGNRHHYPEVFCFRPALVYLPNDLSLHDLARAMETHGHLPELYPMDPQDLLDATRTLDSLLIRAYQHEKGG